LTIGKKKERKFHQVLSSTIDKFLRLDELAMEDFQNEKERFYTLKKTYPEVYKKYPDLITQQQAAEICGIDVQTIRKWENLEICHLPQQ